MAMKRNASGNGKGAMTVQEAGRRGGQTTSDKYGHEFFEEIGRKGGAKVKELIEKGKRAQSQEGRGRRS